MGDALMPGHSSCCRVSSVFPKVVKCVDNRFCGFWLETLTNRFWVNRWCHFLDHFIDIIFQWCSYNHNSDQHICWTRICFKNGWIYGMVSQLPNYMRCVTKLCLTQHIGQALDHYVGRVSKLALTDLLGALPSIMGKGLIILLGGVQALP
jgi:hypothetical protein